MQIQTILYTIGITIFSTNCLRMVYKTEWELTTEFVDVKSKLPFSYVVLYQTDGSSCFDRNSCFERLRSIEEYCLMTWGKTIFNFFIGGDGQIYEGSGFYQTANILRSFRKRSLVVGLIGDFTTTKPSVTVWKGLEDLVKFAIQLQYLKVNYSLLSSDQIIYRDQCENKYDKVLYKEIQSHSNWRNITIIINSEWWSFSN